MRRNGIQDFPGNFTTGHAFCIRRKLRQLGLPAVRDSSRLGRFKEPRKIWKALPVRVEALIPSAAQGGATAHECRMKVLRHAVWDQKFRIFRPAITPLRQSDFVFAQRLAMRGRRVLLVWRAVSDVTIDDDQERLCFRRLEGFDGARESLTIIGIAYMLDTPAIRRKSARNIFAECELGTSLDADVVIVVNPTEIAELEMAGQRRGFACNTFHQIAIAAKSIDVVIEQRETVAIENFRQHPLRHRHTDAVATALAKRSCRGFYAGRMAVFGMTGAAAAELAKALDVLQTYRNAGFDLARFIHVPHASEMQDGIEQHRGVSVGQHKTVAVWPMRPVRIEFEKALPKRVGDRRQAHRGSGVPGFGSLNRIH